VTVLDGDDNVLVVLAVSCSWQCSIHWLGCMYCGYNVMIMTL